MSIVLSNRKKARFLRRHVEIVLCFREVNGLEHYKEFWCFTSGCDQSREQNRRRMRSGAGRACGGGWRGGWDGAGRGVIETHVCSARSVRGGEHKREHDERAARRHAARRRAACAHRRVSSPKAPSPPTFWPVCRAARRPPVQDRPPCVCVCSCKVPCSPRPTVLSGVLSVWRSYTPGRRLLLVLSV